MNLIQITQTRPAMNFSLSHKFNLQIAKERIAYRSMQFISSQSSDRKDRSSYQFI